MEGDKGLTLRLQEEGAAEKAPAGRLDGTPKHSPSAPEHSPSAPEHSPSAPEHSPSAAQNSGGKAQPADRPDGEPGPHELKVGDSQTPETQGKAQAGPAEKMEAVETSALPAIEPGQAPAAASSKPAPPGLSPRLQAIRAGLLDPRAVEAFDAMYEDLGRNSTRMEQALAGIERKLTPGATLEARLIGKWEKGHPTPPSDAIMNVLDANAQEYGRFKTAVGAYENAHPEVKGTHKWIGRANEDLGHINDMRRDWTDVTHERLKDSRNNVAGLEGELQTARETPDVTRVNARFRTVRGDDVDVDVVSESGARWTESKATKPFGLGSKAWPLLREQADYLLQAARNNPVHGRPPRIAIRFIKGVSTDVATELRNMGIEVEGQEIGLGRME